MLFTLLHNFSALEVYKRHLSLLTRSYSAASSQSHERTGLPPTDTLPIYVDLLQTVLLPQFEYLRAEFFAEDLPDAGLEEFLIAELGDHLRKTLRGAGKDRALDESVMPQLETAWSRLSQLVEKKFGWSSLGSLKPTAGRGTNGHDWETVARDLKDKGKTRVTYNLLKETEQDPDSDDGPEYEEDEEDAPVVVEL